MRGLLKRIFKRKPKPQPLEGYEFVSVTASAPISSDRLKDDEAWANLNTEIAKKLGAKAMRYSESELKPIEASNDIYLYSVEIIVVKEVKK